MQTHSLNLQGFKYATELEVFADGYKLCLEDPYNAPRLRIRSPLSDDEEICTFDGDVSFFHTSTSLEPNSDIPQDPYFSEVQAFVDAVDPSNASGLAGDDDVEILSSYDDSLKSYALFVVISVLISRTLLLTVFTSSWAIREASERSAKTARVAKIHAGN